MSSLLAIDIGNHKIAFGLFEDLQQPVRTWSVPTASAADAAWDLLTDVLAGQSGLLVSIASVVPSLTYGFSERVADYAEEVFTLEPGTYKASEVRYNPPADLGPDRLANAIAARRLYGGPSCVVDLGTATTFDVVAEDGAFLGGAIAPGIDTAASALFEKTARLGSPGWKVPSRALGQSTADCLLSGTVLGYGGLVDHLVELLASEAGPFLRVVGTGGMAEFVAQTSSAIQEIRPTLTLEGLNIACRTSRGDL
ncbi:MAG: type III pantothenate kinase [Armatimonadetes bacterium]|nr:type III pantothenate kinase [Armatimonadota bacterium]